MMGPVGSRKSRLTGARIHHKLMSDCEVVACPRCGGAGSIPPYERLQSLEQPSVHGVDISDGIETHVEGFVKDGVLHITDIYEIIDGDKR